MLRAWRFFAVAVVAVIAVAVTQAQIAPQVRLTIGPATLSRGRTSIVDVRAQIPEGYFVPAETRGLLKGAWLQPQPPWISRELPTYPIPDSVRLNGSDTPVLAYSRTFVVHMPVDVPPGLRGPNELSVQFAYQLCDSRGCAAVATSNANAEFKVEEPPPDSHRLAYRVDSQRVVIVTEMQHRLSGEASELVRPLAQFIPPLAILPESHEARTRFVGDFGMGARWVIQSNGPRFGSISEQPAAVSWRCGGDETPLAVIARVTDAQFVSERPKYFLASADVPAANQRSLSFELRLDETERRELEDLIDRQMRVTVPTVFAPVPYIQNPRAQPRETEYDRRVRGGEGRLMYHLEAFTLAPDENPRLYVRAYWGIGARAQIGLTLWIRFDGQHFSVEQTDAGVSRSARYLEMKSVGVDLAARPEYAGMLLNVIPAADGWAYLIIGRRGYESVGVSVWKYSPVGPQDTGIAYVYGC